MTNSDARRLMATSPKLRAAVGKLDTLLSNAPKMDAASFGQDYGEILKRLRT